jgi:hypothetical protein
MQVESLARVLRPRLAAEASDLGVALVHAYARSVWRSFAPVFVVLLVLICGTVEIAPWLPGLLIFWCKPWLDRSLLFILARAVFGQSTRFADLWRERASVWRGQWLRTLLWQRLSSWRAFTQPVYQLEGLRGKALQQRCKLLLRGQRGMAGAMQFAYANVEVAFQFGMIAAALWFTPQDHRTDVFKWLTSAKGGYGALVSACLYAAIVLALEPFYVAAGLAMYLNRRVELEAWDIEQEFRRVFDVS